MEIKKTLGEKKPGCPLLGDNLDKEVQAYLCNLHRAGYPVNTPVAVEAATGLVCWTYSIAGNGGHILLTIERQVLFGICNIGTSGLPDMYTPGPEG